MQEMNATVSQREQWMVEGQVFSIYKQFSELPRRAQAVLLELMRDKHHDYLTNGLRHLPPSFCVLDANRPWLCYWILHSLALLGESISDKLENDTIDFLTRCQDPNGGYGGGPGQMPHLATTYAAVNSLITLGGHRALSSINRVKLYAFLKRMKDEHGCFRMHEKGEIDVRACYTAISVASVLNILDNELVENVGNFILSCQTYEGGIAGEPGSEAHGGYTFCGLATMILINEAYRLDLPALLARPRRTKYIQPRGRGEELNAPNKLRTRDLKVTGGSSLPLRQLRFAWLVKSLMFISWVVFRQGVEGGFQGRTNKLVDGCYSFWQGGVCPLIQRSQQLLDEQLAMTHAREQDVSYGSKFDPLERKHAFSEATSQSESKHMEQEGLLQCAPENVNLSDIGLDFVKHPTNMGPLFHSFALQQYIILCSQVIDGGLRDKPGKGRDFYHTCYCLSGLSVCQRSGLQDVDASPLPHEVLGPYSNLLEPTHPLYNIVLHRYYEARDFFTSF